MASNVLRRQTPTLQALKYSTEHPKHFQDIRTQVKRLAGEIWRAGKGSNRVSHPAIEPSTETQTKTGRGNGDGRRIKFDPTPDLALSSKEKSREALVPPISKEGQSLKGDNEKWQLLLAETEELLSGPFSFPVSVSACSAPSPSCVGPSPSLTSHTPPPTVPQRCREGHWQADPFLLTDLVQAFATCPASRLPHSLVRRIGETMARMIHEKDPERKLRTTPSVPPTPPFPPTARKHHGRVGLEAPESKPMSCSPSGTVSSTTIPQRVDEDRNRAGTSRDKGEEDGMPMGRQISLPSRSSCSFSSPLPAVPSQPRGGPHQPSCLPASSFSSLQDASPPTLQSQFTPLSSAVSFLDRTDVWVKTVRVFGKCRVVVPELFEAAAVRLWRVLPLLDNHDLSTVALSYARVYSKSKHREGGGEIPRKFEEKKEEEEDLSRPQRTRESGGAAVLRLMDAVAEEVCSERRKWNDDYIGSAPGNEAYLLASLLRFHHTHGSQTLLGSARQRVDCPKGGPRGRGQDKAKVFLRGAVSALAPRIIHDLSSTPTSTLSVLLRTVALSCPTSGRQASQRSNASASPPSSAPIPGWFLDHLAGQLVEEIVGRAKAELELQAQQQMHEGNQKKGRRGEVRERKYRLGEDVEKEFEDEWRLKEAEGNRQQEPNFFFEAAHAADCLSVIARLRLQVRLPRSSVETLFRCLELCPPSSFTGVSVAQAAGALREMRLRLPGSMGFLCAVSLQGWSPSAGLSGAFDVGGRDGGSLSKATTPFDTEQPGSGLLPNVALEGGEKNEKSLLLGKVLGGRVGRRGGEGGLECLRVVEEVFSEKGGARPFFFYWDPVSISQFVWALASSRPGGVQRQRRIDRDGRGDGGVLKPGESEQSPSENEKEEGGQEERTGEGEKRSREMQNPPISEVLESKGDRQDFVRGAESGKEDFGMFEKEELRLRRKVFAALVCLLSDVNQVTRFDSECLSMASASLARFLSSSSCPRDSPSLSRFLPSLSALSLCIEQFEKTRVPSQSQQIERGSLSRQRDANLLRGCESDSRFLSSVLLMLQLQRSREALESTEQSPFNSTVQRLPTEDMFALEPSFRAILLRLTHTQSSVSALPSNLESLISSGCSRYNLLFGPLNSVKTGQAVREAASSGCGSINIPVRIHAEAVSSCSG